MTDYHGMKRCRFCNYWKGQDGENIKADEWRCCIVPERDSFAVSYPNDRCHHYEPYGLLPEAWVEVVNA